MSALLGKLLGCCRKASDAASLDSAALAGLADAVAREDWTAVLKRVAEHWQLYENYSAAEQRRLDDAVVAASAAAAVARK